MVRTTQEVRRAFSRLRRSTWQMLRALFRGSPWIDFTAAPGHHPEQLVRVFYALKQAGVRCRYRTLAGNTIGRAGSGAALEMIIVVHRDDMSKAREVAGRVRNQ